MAGGYVREVLVGMDRSKGQNKGAGQKSGMLSGMETFSDQHPLLGVRIWHPTPSGMLASVNNYDAVLWPTHKAYLTAACYRGYRAFANTGRDPLRRYLIRKGVGHLFALDPPVRGCGCGLWAWYDNQICERNEGLAINTGFVRGIVAHRGKVIRYKYGFKAQAMSVQAIVGPPTDAAKYNPIHLPERIARTYAVPLISPEEIDEFMEGMSGIVYWGGRTH